MRADIKSRWVSALRSGKYEQGHNYLNRDRKFCCLGVLCELAVEDGVIAQPVLVQPTAYYSCRDTRPMAYEDDHLTLPYSVMAWARLKSGNPYVNGATLATYNDGDAMTPCHSFEEIADLIEEHIPGEPVTVTTAADRTYLVPTKTPEDEVREAVQHYTNKGITL